MDILKGEGMTLRLYGVLALVLVVGIAAAVFLREEPVKKDAAPPASPHSDEAPPSRENVSQGVRETIAHLKSVVETDPSDVVSMIRLARMLHDAHNASEAAVYYERAISLDGRNDSLRVDYSLCLFEMGRVQEALQQNMVVYRRDHRNTQALYNLGAIHANTGRKDSAITYWNRLISTAPEDPLADRARQGIRQLGVVAQ